MTRSGIFRSIRYVIDGRLIYVCWLSIADKLSDFLKNLSMNRSKSAMIQVGFHLRLFLRGNTEIYFSPTLDSSPPNF